MIEHCDFERADLGRSLTTAVLRPDLIVKLPGGKNVVVDAKVPARGVPDALEAEDEDERARAPRGLRAPRARPPHEARRQVATGQLLATRPSSSCCSCPSEAFHRRARAGARPDRGRRRRQRADRHAHLADRAAEAWSRTAGARRRIAESARARSAELGPPALRARSPRWLGDHFAKLGRAARRLRAGLQRHGRHRSRRRCWSARGSSPSTASESRQGDRRRRRRSRRRCARCRRPSWSTATSSTTTTSRRCRDSLLSDCLGSAR